MLPARSSLRSFTRSVLSSFSFSAQRPLSSAMPASPPFHQEPHKLLVIPGPIEVSDDVLYANAHPAMSHVSPEFIPILGDCIRMTREVLLAPTSQPFLISGSGTLGWDQVAANLVEPGEDVLVLKTGYFGDSFEDCLTVYGANVHHITAPVGDVVSQADIAKALKERKYKIVTFTHVDTSTGVLSDAKMIGHLVKELSPETLVVLDGVCSVASEEIRQEEWNIDVVLSASQKGLGVPPGLSILSASQKAIKVFQERKTPVTSYYASWQKWLPVMQAYEKGTAAYFATPPVNLVYALHKSLSIITKESPTLVERWKLHSEASAKVKDACAALGLKQVPVNPENAANGMTAVYFPEGITAGDVIPRLSQLDVVVAGGLHKDIKDKYFRIGHMGVTAVEHQRGDLEKIISSLGSALKDAQAAKNS
ncbi:PLP-dependent transferase [Sistotremastrum niveocremeum HHB9708]|uniref:alanine--glyoxylate transaminase n=1 Tax=Sistotremastrum niveocremeum HHB9708 TaxID=1314777 RepID=A0A164VQ79_9AGAM|nr:PLP-dependent transferase [Sistotremastrum niveocremeum HHB9708]